MPLTGPIIINNKRNCTTSPSNAVLVPLLKCNKIMGRGNKLLEIPIMHKNQNKVSLELESTSTLKNNLNIM